MPKFNKQQNKKHTKKTGKNTETVVSAVFYVHMTTAKQFSMYSEMLLLPGTFGPCASWSSFNKVPYRLSDTQHRPAGTKPRTSQHRSPGEKRCRKRKRSRIFLERSNEGHHQSDEHWSCLKLMATLGKLLRQGGAHIGFSKHTDTILKWTEQHGPSSFISMCYLACVTYYSNQTYFKAAYTPLKHTPK